MSMRARNGKQRAKEHEWATAHQSPVKMIFFYGTKRLVLGWVGGIWAHADLKHTHCKLKKNENSKKTSHLNRSCHLFLSFQVP